MRNIKNSDRAYFCFDLAMATLTILIFLTIIGGIISKILEQLAIKELYSWIIVATCISGLLFFIFAALWQIFFRVDDFIALVRKR